MKVAKKSIFRRHFLCYANVGDVQTSNLGEKKTSFMKFVIDFILYQIDNSFFTLNSSKDYYL